MYYCYAEKKDSGLFRKWQVRIIAFDTVRRYLYYSAPLHSSAVPPATPRRAGSEYSSMNVSPGLDWLSGSAFHCPNTPSSPYTLHQPSEPGSTTTNASPFTSHISFAAHPSSREDLGSRRPPLTFAAASDTAEQSNLSIITSDELNEVSPDKLTHVRWSGKLKLEAVIPIAKKQECVCIDKDTLRVDLRGCPRPIAAGEAPAAGPLLCSTAGLSGGEERCEPDNWEYIKDRFLLLELYRSLTEQFSMLELGRQTAMGRRSKATNLQGTLSSPRASTGQRRPSLDADYVPAPNLDIVELTVRFRNEYQFHRFLYVTLTVLGYDELTIRPFCGFPPYDPRNQIALSPLPVEAWYHFRRMETEMIYLMIHGSVLVTNGLQQTSSTTSPLTMDHVYLCLAYDAVLILKPNGLIPMWARWEHVEGVRYQRCGPQPFVAFLSTGNANVDIVFSPTDVCGKASTFNGMTEVDRIHHITHDLCFRSIEARRVIDIREAEQPTPEVFLHAMQASGHSMNIDVTAVRGRCPRTPELFSFPWREVHRLSASMGAEGDLAIPLYENSPQTPFALSPRSWEEIHHHLERRRGRRNSTGGDIVGISEREVFRLLESSRRPHDSDSGSGSVPHFPQEPPPLLVLPTAPRQRHSDPTATSPFDFSRDPATTRRTAEDPDGPESDLGMRQRDAEAAQAESVLLTSGSLSSLTHNSDLYGIEADYLPNGNSPSPMSSEIPSHLRDYHVVLSNSRVFDLGAGGDGPAESS